MGKKYIAPMGLFWGQNNYII